MTMTRRRCAVVLTLPLLLPASRTTLWAQTEEPAPVVQPLPGPPRYVDPGAGISIEELVSLALQRAPAMAAIRTEIDVARGELVQASLRPNPTATAGRQEQVDGSDNQTLIHVEVPLDLFRRTARVATAERRVDAVSWSVADRERLLAAAVREQSGRVLADVRKLVVADELLQLNRRSRELLQARVTEGASPPLELDLVDVEVRRHEAQRALQAGQVEAALVGLKALVGLPSDAPLVLRQDLDAVVREDPTVPEAAALAGETPSAAIEQRPDLREATARVRLADARIEQMRREGRFDVGVYGSYMRTHMGFPQRGFDAQGNPERVRGLFNNAAFGAMVMLPLRNRNQGAIAAADADRRGAERLQAARELTARAEIAAAAIRDRAAHRAVALYGQGARDLARRNLDVVREAYQLGRSTLFDVFAEQQRYLEVETAYTQALSEAFQARVALRRALGVTR